MMRFDFSEFRLDPNSGIGGLYQRVTGKPSWPMKAALVVGVLVVVVPLAILAISGLVIGAATFIALSLIARAVIWFRGLFGDRGDRTAQPLRTRDGRRNVRVIHEE